MEYLVESHLGGYYISSLDPDVIEEICEQCFDSDRIVASWIKKNNEDKIQNICNYFCGKEVNETIYNNYLEDSQLENLMDIMDDIEDMFMYFVAIVEDLNECRYIDDETSKIICNNILLQKQEWLDFSKSYGFNKVLIK